MLAPHLYPPSITRNPPETFVANQHRWNLSWGLKMQGLDTTSQVYVWQAQAGSGRSVMWRFTAASTGLYY